MSDYARPESLEEALTLLAKPGAVAMGGGTDLAGQIDRGNPQTLWKQDLLTTLVKRALNTLHAQ